MVLTKGFTTVPKKSKFGVSSMELLWETFWNYIIFSFSFLVSSEFKDLNSFISWPVSS